MMIGTSLALTGRKNRRGLSLDFTTGLPPGLTFSRIGAGLAQRLDGSWVSFATGVPRQTNRGLLIEEARTNLIPYSNLTTLPSGSVNISLANGAASPIEGNTAKTVSRATTNTNSYVQQTITTQASGTTVTMTIIAKAGVGGRLGMRLSGAYPERADAVFDLAAGTVIGSLSGGTGTFTNLQTAIEPNGSDGFYRCTLKATVGSSSLTTVLFGPTDSTRTVGSWEGPTTPLCSLDADGWQAEVGTSASSVIGTNGATATRGGDTPIFTALSALLAAPYVMSVSGEMFAADWISRRFVVASDTGFNNSVNISRGGANQFVTQVVIGGVNTTSVAAPNYTGARSFKAAVRVRASRFDGALDGAFQTGGVSNAPPVDRVHVGHHFASAPLNGYIQRINIIPGDLTDAQLQAVTQ